MIIGENLKNKQFGALIVLHKIGKTNKNRQMWLCLCSCGKQTKAIHGHLTSGNRTSCGCRKLNKEEYRKDIKDVCTQNVSKQYQKNAGYKDREFLLNFSEIKSLIFSNCNYCGISPSNIFTARRRISQSVYENEVKYSGIDRVDSSKGYNVINCVSCCKTCNRAKSDLTKEEFIQWVEKTYLFLKKT